MKNKKILLFIVEGITDQTCLGFVLSKILNSNKVEFALIYGDITSKTGIDSNNIATEIGEIVKQFSGKIFKASDFIEIVHLVDMDGAYIKFQIFVDNVEAILHRNKQKSDKFVCAEHFENSYGCSPKRFLDFLNTPEIAVQKRAIRAINP
ncbi:hypothetical protein [Phosphitispora fastidiosa]|uniref:hypothetical protein n=1 Tax=Phosphitispora fastidiosa TaxID=2837202 RepID=UPI001E57C8C7|nr:hypothetical protein [Phosphitispora fastidiosa]MBU7006239.1 sulfur carrier protein ThiS [Phosphitispora fastidiosa]